MKKLLSVLCALSICLVATASVSKKKADKDTNQYRYEIECAGNGTQGTYLVKVWTYSKKANVAENQCRKNAIIFFPSAAPQLFSLVNFVS